MMRKKKGVGFRVVCDGDHRTAGDDGRTKNEPPATEWFGEPGPARKAATADGFRRYGMQHDYCKDCAL